MPYRALFKQVNGPLRPRTSGKAFSSGQKTSSSTISPVIEVRRPTLPWMACALNPFHPFSSTTPPDLASIVLCPNDKNIGDRAVGDPHLGAGEAITAVYLPGARD